ncbi:MAG: outer membrane protein assembly factor BamB family protein [Planctomycetota bacterium]|jgi:outer membrane protein assembly factor BamB
MRKAILILIMLSVVSTTIASERLVPNQYPTIQDAINVADNGDTVIVEANTYREKVDFMGKAITVRSSNPNDFETVKNTIIDGRGLYSCVVFSAGESSNSILEGFTITNGGGTYFDYSYNGGQIIDKAGGGIFCLNSSPTIRYCNIIGNEVSVPISRRPRNEMSNITTISCVGGGIALIGNCEATIDNCFITNNQADYGTGIIIRSYTPEQAVSTISNCTIADNHSRVEVSVYEIDCWDTKSVIYNTIIWNRDYRSLLIADPSLVTYCCVKEAYIFEGDYNEFAEPFDLAGTGGNINQNPLFVLSAVDLEKGDYHLLPDSPCVNAGEPELVDSDKLDMDGQSRLLGGRIDIGADEVLSQIYVSTPTGGEVWASGSTHEIKWMSNAVSTVDVVDILLSVNGGTDWQTIGTGIPNTGSKIWSLPEMIDSNNCRILVVPGISDSNIICTESNVFTIRPYSPGVAVESKWESLGGNFARTGLSDSNGPESGCIKWQFETTMAVSASVTVGLDNTVYIPCEDGKLYAIDPNGSLIWNYDANTPLISSPTLGPDSTVYVGGMNGKLYAVDINGNLLWTHSTGGFIYSSPAVSTESKIYVGSQDGVLYALDRDGSELWRFETKGPGKIQMGSIFASPAIGADETVYIAGLYDPNLYALDPADGSIKWTCNFESQGWPFASPVIADDGTIYQTLLYDTNLYAIESQTGSIIWSVDLADPAGGWFDPNYIQDYGDADGWSEPALGPDGTIYVSFDDPYLRAVDPTGKIKWVRRLGDMGGFTLTTGNKGNIYAACDDGNLYVVNPNGEEIARFQSQAWLNFPVIVDNLLIVADSKDNSMLVTYENNKVYAITPECSEGQIPDLYWPEDLNSDGIINVNDMTLLATYWLN